MKKEKKQAKKDKKKNEKRLQIEALRTAGKKRTEAAPNSEDASKNGK